MTQCKAMQYIITWEFCSHPAGQFLTVIVAVCKPHLWQQKLQSYSNIDRPQTNMLQHQQQAN